MWVRCREREKEWYKNYSLHFSDFGSFFEGITVIFLKKKKSYVLIIKLFLFALAVCLLGNLSFVSVDAFEFISFTRVWFTLSNLHVKWISTIDGVTFVTRACKINRNREILFKLMCSALKYNTRCKVGSSVSFFGSFYCHGVIVAIL